MQRRLNPVTLIVVGLVSTALCVFALRLLYQNTLAAETTVTLDSSSIDQGSQLQVSRGRTIFSLSGRTKGRLYHARDRGTGAVYEFLNKNIDINAGASGTRLTKLTGDLKPGHIFDDRQDPQLVKINRADNRVHYSFTQHINSLPLYGSRVMVHVKDDQDVYAFNGTLLTDTTLEPSRVTDVDARHAAQDDMSRQASSEARIVSEQTYAVNPAMLGISADTHTYPARLITAIVTTGQITIPRQYVVSLTNGEILQEVDLTNDALNRSIYDCHEDTSGSCTLIRPEGGVSTGVADADEAYLQLGDIYSYYKNQQQRDSYNNQGGEIRTFVDVPKSVNGVNMCPNAQWAHATNTSTNQLLLCPGFAKQDVMAHEFTHGVVEYTAGLSNTDESGTINESIADIFAVNVDDDWAIGEDLSFGAIRHLDDPSQNRSISSTGTTASSPMADRLYSSRYYCGTGDHGGVHQNMSVVTYAYYLMSAGGSFNGCTITGVGKQTAVNAWYQALTKYLGPTANYHDVYDAVNQGCADIYGVASSQCTQMKKAMQATELDQQPLGVQQGPKCTNQAAQAATCVGIVDPTIAVPTNTPIPVASNTPVPQSTATPTPNACTNHVDGDGNNDGHVSLTDFEAWRRAYTGL